MAKVADVKNAPVVVKSQGACLEPVYLRYLGTRYGVNQMMPVPTRDTD